MAIKLSTVGCKRGATELTCADEVIVRDSALGLGIAGGRESAGGPRGRHRTWRSCGKLEELFRGKVLEVWVMDPTSAAAVQSQKRVSTRAASL
jgi:hypothetical protein